MKRKYCSHKHKYTIAKQSECNLGQNQAPLIFFTNSYHFSFMYTHWLSARSMPKMHSTHLSVLKWSSAITRKRPSEGGASYRRVYHILAPAACLQFYCGVCTSVTPKSGPCSITVIDMGKGAFVQQAPSVHIYVQWVALPGVVV